MTMTIADQLQDYSRVSETLDSEPKDLGELFGEKKESIRSEEVDLIDDCINSEVDRMSEDLRRRGEHMSLKERQSAVNTSNAITGVMVAWSLIGMVRRSRKNA